MGEEVKKVNTAYLYFCLSRELNFHMHGLDVAIPLWMQICGELEDAEHVGVDSGGVAGPISRSS